MDVNEISRNIRLYFGDVLVSRRVMTFDLQRSMQGALLVKQPIVLSNLVLLLHYVIYHTGCIVTFKEKNPPLKKYLGSHCKCSLGGGFFPSFV